MLQLFQAPPEPRWKDLDAWANVSHYLDYKNETAIPKSLKKDFYALSGLFYIADSHFEMFYNASNRSTDTIWNDFQEATPNLNVEINFDSLTAYLNMKFSSRELDDSKGVSELIKEVRDCGYTSIAQLNETVECTEDAAKRYEELCPPSNEYGERVAFSRIGIMRTILEIVNDEYFKNRNLTDKMRRIRNVCCSLVLRK